MARLGILGLLLLALPALCEQTNRYGLNVHVPQGSQLALLANAEQSGAGWIRVDVDWSLVEPVKGTRDWSVYDAITAAAAARGLFVYGTLAYTPAWATDGLARTGVPRAASEWAAFCAAAAQRYASTIPVWGIWNEPNLTQFWSGTRQQYVDVALKPGADAIHAANPHARVAGPELAHLTAGAADWYTWLSDVLAQASSRLDIVSHHVYDPDGAADVTAKLDGETTFGTQPQYWIYVSPSLREVLALSGWLGRPVWLTETGWASDVVGEGAQAMYTNQLLTTWFTAQPGKSWVEKVFIYELVDDAAPGVPKYGLLRPDATRKPSFTTLQTFIANLVPGDVNGDRVVSVADVLYLINYLYAGGPPPLGPADPDRTHVVDVRDVLFLINYVFGGGPSPA